MTHDKNLRPKEAAAMLGIGVATLWRWQKEKPGFPQSIRLSARCTVFSEKDLLNWQKSTANHLVGSDLSGLAAPMGMRDWFAGLAMQAYCSDQAWRRDTNADQTARAAYSMADAMLNARGK